MRYYAIRNSVQLYVHLHDMYLYIYLQHYSMYSTPYIQ